MLIPQLLDSLPYYVFATSSLDALIHAVEASLSPRANDFTLMTAQRAITLIVSGYQAVVRGGEDARRALHGEFLLASNYAGIALSVSGAGAVHAMSYPIGGDYHVPHGESNYALFTAVLERYHAMAPDGGIRPAGSAAGPSARMSAGRGIRSVLAASEQGIKTQTPAGIRRQRGGSARPCRKMWCARSSGASNNYAPFSETDIPGNLPLPLLTAPGRLLGRTTERISPFAHRLL